MNILIKGIEMPEKHITLNIFPNGYVAIYDATDSFIGETKAFPVPKHGDLIDKYDLKNKKIAIDYDEWDDTFEDGLLFVTDLIDNAPVIIPAEES
jgi:hypothetical protein